jgi:alkanesulfonate monooxygenase SsuD/methylene tetrahydromethanopterin reductase-like flavin-dependent oxidoreductase (luciferase family)
MADDDGARVRRAVYVAPFGELADPRALADVAAACEHAGWDGVFVWDHVWRPEQRASEVGDAWISLAAMAGATERVRLGPMVVPLARRRPQVVARASVALDRLSGGRLTMGVGLGVDTGGELARFGEEVDPRRRAERLDEAIDVLRALWSGEPVTHRGQHYLADDVRFRPVPLQPRLPIWGAAWGGSPGTRPVRRAARLDGLFPWQVSPEQLREMVSLVATERGSLEGFDVAAVSNDPRTSASMVAAGATWLVHALPEGVTVRDAMRAATNLDVIA